MQDETDSMCKSYGLSLFESSEKAKGRYRTIYFKRRKHLRPLFIAELGDYVAELRLDYADGIISPASESGHLTFHEYEETDLRRKIVNIREIFDKNGELNV